VHLSWKGRGLSNHWGTISSTAGRETGGLLSSTGRPGKPKSYVCPFQRQMMDAKRHTKPARDTSLLAGKGEADSEACRLLCHLLLEQYDCTPAITQGLWKSHNLVPILTGWSFSGLYLVLLGRKGVLLAVTSTKTRDSVSSGT